MASGDNEDMPACYWRVEKDMRGQWVVVPPRNHPKMVMATPWHLCGCRSNCDMQYICSFRALVSYVLKYQTKAEKKSSAFQSMFQDIFRDVAQRAIAADRTPTVQGALNKVLNIGIGARDYSSVETCHLLLGLPLTRCSRTTVDVSLDGGAFLEPAEDGDGIRLAKTWKQWYAARPADLEEVTFYELVAQFNKEYNERKGPLAVPVFKPWRPATPTDPNHEEYCRMKLLMHVAWREEGDVLQQFNVDNYTAAFYEWVESGEAPLVVQREFLSAVEDELAAMQMGDDREQHSDLEEEDRDARETDDELALFQVLPSFRNDDAISPVHANHDWEEAGRAWHVNPVDIEGWIMHHKESGLEGVDLDEHLAGIHLDRLNANQAFVVDIVAERLTRMLQPGASVEQLLLYIMGTAGTGKSYTVHAILKKVLQITNGQRSAIALAAPSGCAALNIKGQTLHSLLSLPVNKAFEELEDEKLFALQARCEHLKILVIDERSMVGQVMLSRVDRRLRQATGVADLPFGGVSVILVGDDGQLPPVGDMPLYSKSVGRRAQEAIEGVTAYQQFKDVVELDRVERQDGDSPFLQVLLRIRDGDIQMADWEWLKTRQLQTLPAHEQAAFASATRLMAKASDVRDWNMDKIRELGKPIARIRALHNYAIAAQADADDAAGLETEICLAEGATVMLRSNLWLDHGLVNGAVGVVKAIVYNPGTKPPDVPAAVLVHFPGYTGPGFNGVPGLVVVEALTCPPFMYKGKFCTRTQLPLSLAWAITIHKSQGMTIGPGNPIQRAVVNIGSEEFAAGLTFVALSRAKNPECFAWDPAPDFARLQRIAKGKNLKARKHEEQRLRNMAADTKVRYRHLLRQELARPVDDVDPHSNHQADDIQHQPHTPMDDSTSQRPMRFRTVNGVWPCSYGTIDTTFDFLLTPQAPTLTPAAMLGMTPIVGRASGSRVPLHTRVGRPARGRDVHFKVNPGVTYDEARALIQALEISGISSVRVGIVESDGQGPWRFSGAVAEGDYDRMLSYLGELTRMIFYTHVA
eukprot:jgi/Mesvir1/8974/Mv25463-RA.1